MISDINLDCASVFVLRSSVKHLFCLQVVHSKFQDLVPKPIEDDDPEMERPDEEQIRSVSINELYITSEALGFCIFSQND